MEVLHAISTGILWITYFLSLYFSVFWLIVFLSEKRDTRKKRLTSYPQVTVAIPAYNEERCIRRTILNLLKLRYPVDRLEIIVVDDGSTDKTSSVVKRIMRENKGYDIKLIEQENHGKGTALNKALKAAAGEYFVCLDADSFVKNDALERMLPYFDDPDVAVVLPVLKVHKPKNLLQKMQWYEYLINMFFKELMAKLDCVHVAPGPFSVYRKETLLKVGMFDDNHNLTEDLEMALRLQSHNYKLVQLLGPEVTTIAPDNLKELYKQRNRWYKGAILNSIKYRRMMLNRKYGDFGMIQMPTIIISGIIALVMVLSIIYYSLKPYVLYLYNMFFINFDFMTLLRNMKFTFNFLDLDFTLFTVAVIMICVSVFLLKKSHTYTKERVFKFGKISLLMYMMVYFIVLGVMWIGITFDLLVGRKQRW
ncbi:glycosyltransferase family 2 protein [Candidatus Woesearchaeota archaeon]|nr:glycosyltransferase family 2 protein [Candidatus Woesearchaeota archaeon]